MKLFELYRYAKPSPGPHVEIIDGVRNFFNATRWPNAAGLAGAGRVQLDHGINAVVRVAEPQVEEAQRAARVREMIGQLPPKDQVFVQLFYFQGLPIEEVAETIGITTNAAYVRKMRLHDKLPYAEYREVMGGIDIALDPFPYTGTTTTCDTLWQGIPVVSLAGDSAVSRSGYALLKSVGLEELVARDEPDYVRLAVALAGDVARLQSLRASLRARMEASPLRDEAGFTRALEAAYREMWRTWCAGP